MIFSVVDCRVSLLDRRMNSVYHGFYASILYVYKFVFLEVLDEGLDDIFRWAALVLYMPDRTFFSTF